jgi:selenocysteine lyase/cysteine desulfurase
VKSTRTAERRAEPSDSRVDGALLDELRADVIGADACLDGPFGPRRIAYADHIASGRALGSIERTLREGVLPTYANTHTDDSFTGARTTRIAHQAGAYLKRAVGADETYAIAFPGTGATGAVKRLQEILGVAVPCSRREALLAALPEEERPVVFVGPYEHHSNEVSWRESLAEVVTVPLGPDGRLDVGALEALLTSPRYARRPKLGSFSAASNVTGIRTEVPTVARTLRRHGAWVAFDYAAAAPYVEIDVRPNDEAQIDAVMLSPHKLLGGPGSPGMLVFHRDLYRLRSPTTAGGGTVAYVGPEGHDFLDDVEAREDAGTPAIVQRIRAALAFRVKERVGAASIEAREDAWRERALARLSAHPAIEVLGPTDVPRLAVVSFLVRDLAAPATAAGRAATLHPRFVVRLLSDLFGVQGRAGCSCAGPYGHALLSIDAGASAAYRHAIEEGYEGVKPGWARVSFHWLDTAEEVDFLLDAIEFVAERGARFLPLYAFDWRTGAWSWRGGLAGLPGPESARHADAFDPDAWRPPRRSREPRARERARYLAEARGWADRLAEGHAAGARPAEVPAGVDRRLVFFSTP